MGTVLIVDTTYVCDSYGSIDSQIDCFIAEKEKLEKQGWINMHLVSKDGDFYIEGRRPF